MNERRSDLDSLKQEIEINPSIEGRATTFVERLSRLLRDAAAANDMTLVRSYAEELGRNSVNFGQAIVSARMRTGAGQAG